MKILMVSMPTLHFFRWTDQLKNEGHEVYWFNITDSRAYVDKLDWVDQKYGWRSKISLKNGFLSTIQLNYLKTI